MITRFKIQHSPTASAKMPAQESKQLAEQLAASFAGGKQKLSLNSLSSTSSPPPLLATDSASPPSSLSTNASSSDSSPSASYAREAAPAAVAVTEDKPVLIKYNYYDYTGAKLEQSNFDPNFRPHDNMGARHRANLRSPSPPAQHTGSGELDARKTCRSPQEESVAAMLHLARRFHQSSYENHCLRCGKTVYQMDKLGPLKDFTFYHQNCFKCFACGTKLTLRTYFNNQQSSDDKEVYCHRHCPKTLPGKLDNQSVGIRLALNAPKVFELPLACANLTAPDVGAGATSALHIRHAVQQTKLQNIYRQSQVDQKISAFLTRRLEYLRPKQEMLEMQHRQEEDALFREFKKRWLDEEADISRQIRDEWQNGLDRLIDKYKCQLRTFSALEAASHAQHVPPQPQPPEANHGRKETDDERQMIEAEKMNLEKTLTLKLDKKKETLKRKLKEFERQATAELVEKQSREMLALVSVKLSEFKEEQRVSASLCVCVITRLQVLN